MNKCKNCHWWKRHTQMEGECLKIRDYRDGKLIITFEQEFCGMFEKSTTVKQKESWEKIYNLGRKKCKELKLNLLFLDIVVLLV